ncbi:MAG TPA: hypothetical protein VFG83_05085 [Kofleriaceae bacterium]|nr:hypothetical protein [Kofleriaceae bacterium]
MARQSVLVSGSQESRGRAPVTMAVIALLAACAGFAIPGKTGELSGISTVLAVAAMATIAGHRWGVLVIAAADVALVAEVWPIVAHLVTIPGYAHPEWTRAGAGFALALAAPGVVVFAITLPRTVTVLVGHRSGPRHDIGLAAAAILACAYLAVPAARIATTQSSPSQKTLGHPESPSSETGASLSKAIRKAEATTKAGLAKTTETRQKPSAKTTTRSGSWRLRSRRPSVR